MPWPLEHLTRSASAFLREAPAQGLFAPRRHLIEKSLQDRRITAKQIWRLFGEETGLSVSYSTMKRYLRAHSSFGTPPVTVRVEVRPRTEALIRKILFHHAMRNLRKAQAMLRLAEKYGKEPMETASQRSLCFRKHNQPSIKIILEKGLDQTPEPPACLFHLCHLWDCDPSEPPTNSLHQTR